MRKLWDFWKNKKYGKKSMTGWFLLTNALLCGVIGAALYQKWYFRFFRYKIQIQIYNFYRLYRKKIRKRLVIIELIW